MAKAKDLRFHPRARKRDALPPLHAERLYESLGAERPLDEQVRTLRYYVQSLKPPAVGAALVTCSDEAERECVDAFQRGFVRYMLPHLKLASRAEFRLANLGGRYEWGAARIAEEHYALAPGADDWKLMVVKINAHVSVENGPKGRAFGQGKRYGNDSTYCGAIAATLAGDARPFAGDLAEAMRFEEHSRLQALRDPTRVRPEHRLLFAAAVSARLQARRAMLDIQDYVPRTPTLWLVLPCLTLNRREHDSELLLGVYTADRRGDDPHDEYCGLGDLPERYRLRDDAAALAIEDDALHQPRRAREHRSQVVSVWRAEEREAHPVDARLEYALANARGQSTSPYARAALKSLMGLALTVAPVPAALVLFGEGLIGIHHANRAHRLAREADQDDVARSMLREVEAKVEALPPEQAQHLIQLLLAEYDS
ncbi:MAG: hypothetical protein AAF682_12870 [Planctomycetota bacterium]